jgi:hypothetical protein
MKLDSPSGGVLTFRGNRAKRRRAGLFSSGKIDIHTSAAQREREQPRGIKPGHDGGRPDRQPPSLSVNPDAGRLRLLRDSARLSSARFAASSSSSKRRRSLTPDSIAGVLKRHSPPVESPASPARSLFHGAGAPRGPAERPGAAAPCYSFIECETASVDVDRRGQGRARSTATPFQRDGIGIGRGALARAGKLPRHCRVKKPCRSLTAAFAPVVSTHYTTRSCS